MSVCPTDFDEKVECPFVDRKEFIEAFENAFRNIDQKNYSILVYYALPELEKPVLERNFQLCSKNTTNRTSTQELYGLQ